MTPEINITDKATWCNVRLFEIYIYMLEFLWWQIIIIIIAGVAIWISLLMLVVKLNVSTVILKTSSGICFT